MRSRTRLAAWSRFGASACLALLVAGCSDRPSPPPPGTARAITSLSDIAGPWDIVRFDGYSPVRLHGGVRRAFVDVRRDVLSYVIECNYSGSRARIDTDGVLRELGDDLRVQTEQGCPPDREARDRAFFGFFTSAPRVTWIEGGRLRLSNGRNELVLERPEQRRLAFVPSLSELQGRWFPQIVHRVDDSGGYEGWGVDLDQPLEIAGDRIRWTGCGGVTFRFRYLPGGRIESLGQEGAPDCGSNSQAAFLLRVVKGNPQAERTAEGGLALTKDNLVVSFISEAARAQAAAPRASRPGDIPPPPAPPPPPPTR